VVELPVLPAESSAGPVDALALVLLAPVEPATLVIPGSEEKPRGEVSPHATKKIAARE